MFINPNDLPYVKRITSVPLGHPDIAAFNVDHLKDLLAAADRHIEFELVDDWPVGSHLIVSTACIPETLDRLIKPYSVKLRLAKISHAWVVIEVFVSKICNDPLIYLPRITQLKEGVQS